MIEQLTSRLRQCRSLNAAIETILDDTVALHGAEYGDIQLRCGKLLLIVAQRNLTSEFLVTFRQVRPTDGSACGRAMRTRSTIVIEDVETDQEFAPYREAARKAKYRGVQTTPLCTKRGRFLGAVSTLFVNPHVPTAIELHTLEQYGRIAADYLLELAGTLDLEEEARRLNGALYAGLAETGSSASSPSN